MPFIDAGTNTCPRDETELDRESETNGPLFVRQRFDTSDGESIMFYGWERSNEPLKDSGD